MSLLVGEPCGYACMQAGSICINSQRQMQARQTRCGGNPSLNDPAENATATLHPDIRPLRGITDMESSGAFPVYCPHFRHSAGLGGVRGLGVLDQGCEQEAYRLGH